MIILMFLHSASDLVLLCQLSTKDLLERDMETTGKEHVPGLFRLSDEHLILHFLCILEVFYVVLVEI